MAKQVMMTEEGLHKLEAELEQLKSVKRREVSEKIKVSLSFGDLSENSEYDEAKNEQAIVESRILELEEMLKNVQVIDSSELAADTIHIGTRVIVYDSEFDEEETYQIVGSKEANPVENKISDESPVGRALLGHHVGDQIDVETPGGTATYKVVEITQ